MLLFKLLLFTLYAYSAQCKFMSSCHPTDSVCFGASMKEAYANLVKGDSSLGIEPIEPLHIDEIDGNLSTLNYTFYNSEIKGYGSCDLNNARVDLDALTLHYELDCPGFENNGQYEISGQLIILPVQGKGDYRLTTGKYVTVVDAELKKYQGKDGKTYLAIKNFKLQNDPKEPIVFDFKNLFNGQKQLADPVLKFANENWKEVATFVQDPVWYACLKKIISNSNKFLKTEAMDEIFILQ